MPEGDIGAKQQEIFNENVANQPVVYYDNPPTSGAIQDQLRNRRDPNVHSN
jgi:hypothetical protein